MFYGCFSGFLMPEWSWGCSTLISCGPAESPTLGTIRITTQPPLQTRSSSYSPAAKATATLRVQIYYIDRYRGNFPRNGRVSRASREKLLVVRKLVPQATNLFPQRRMLNLLTKTRMTRKIRDHAKNALCVTIFSDSF